MLFYIGFLILITRGGGCEQNHDGFMPSHERTGVG